LLLPREFDVEIERDGEGYYVASVRRIRGCHTQARSLDEVGERSRSVLRWKARRSDRGGMSPTPRATLLARRLADGVAEVLGADRAAAWKGGRLA